MTDLGLHEAQLFRILRSFFGKERVLVRISLLSVCGGELPPVKIKGKEEENLEESARENKCLFTVVDEEDQPGMVLEFASSEWWRRDQALQADQAEAVDLKEFEHQQLLRPVLKARGIHYITLTEDEFSEMLDPASDLDFVTLLKAKVDESEINISVSRVV